MRKHFLVPQPPLSDKYRLLVDDINETETFAMTLDIDKVWYNRKIIGEDMSIMLETYTALSDKGTTVLQPIGRYITIWQISKDEKTQRIWFIDHESNLSFREVGRQIMAIIFLTMFIMSLKKFTVKCVESFQKKWTLFNLFYQMNHKQLLVDK